MVYFKEMICRLVIINVPMNVILFILLEVMAMVVKIHQLGQLVYGVVEDLVV
jgi:hypothetical protein